MFDKLREMLLIVCALVGSAALVHAQTAADPSSDGKYAGAFLEIPVGARALSMGGAYTAVADDESAFHWNPAGVSLVHHKLAGFMYSAEYGTPGSSLADFWQAGFTLPLANITIAANWERLSVGNLLHTPDLTNINITDERQRMVREIYGGTPDYFSDHEDAVVLSIARDNKATLDWGWLYYKQEIEVPIGVNFKLIRQSVGTYGSGQGIGVDAGAMLRFSLGDFLMVPALGKIAFGGSVTDIAGTRLNWSTERSQIIPMHILGGIAYEQQIPGLHASAKFATDFYIAERQQMRFGLDVTYRDNLSIRAGLDQGLFATGAGFNWQKKIDLNYSLALNNDLGPEHRLSFAIDLDNIFNPAE